MSQHCRTLGVIFTHDNPNDPFYQKTSYKWHHTPTNTTGNRDIYLLCPPHKTAENLLTLLGAWSYGNWIYSPMP